MAELNQNKDQVKVVAFYLPQYHAIPENDKSWGEGFTEWTNTRKAVPLFEGHYQPKTPLNKNYYCLLDPQVRQWQSDLAKKYGVWGFCYYHYWFKDGKKLLEKPAEMLLEESGAETPFCFCWANENWARRWDGGNKEIIMEQDYGEEEDWEKHFQYLARFFRDPRYITWDGRPVLVIYRPEIIPRLEEMLNFFRRRGEEEGFGGLEIMFQHPSYLHTPEYDPDFCDHYIAFEPAYTWMDPNDPWMKTKNLVKKLLGKGLSQKVVEARHQEKTLELPDYDKTWKTILSRKFPSDKFLWGAFVNWDNTPRNKAGLAYRNWAPEKFREYFARLVKKVRSSSQANVIFINAWNEWGEGCYLEPDEKYGYSCLEAVRDGLKG